jgi:hypothetical protein
VQVALSLTSHGSQMESEVPGPQPAVPVSVFVRVRSASGNTTISHVVGAGHAVPARELVRVDFVAGSSSSLSLVVVFAKAPSRDARPVRSADIVAGDAAGSRSVVEAYTSDRPSSTVTVAADVLALKLDDRVVLSRQAAAISSARGSTRVTADRHTAAVTR